MHCLLNRGKILLLDPWIEVGEEKSQILDLKFSDGMIRGRLVSSEGKPLAGVVSLERAGGLIHFDEEDSKAFSPVDSVVTAEDGSFELRPEAAGDYLLKTGLKESFTQTVGPFSLGHDQVLDLQDVVLKPETALRVLTLDPSGAPLEPRKVEAFVDASGAFGYMGDANERNSVNGLTVLEGLAPGTYTLVGLHASYPPAFLENVEVPAKDSRDPFVMRFTYGGSLDLLLLRADGEPIQNEVPHIVDGKGRNVTYLYSFLGVLHSGGTMAGTMTDSTGRIRLANVLPGDYVVSISRAGKSAERNVTIVAGQTTSVKLVIGGE